MDTLRSFIGGVTITVDKPTDAEPPAPTVATNSASAPRFVHRLVVGDHVHIAVFREDSLTTEATIDGFGNISLALVGDIHLAGLTLSEARKNVEDAYRATGELHEPVGVSMSIADYAPQEVGISGQVKNPGRYLLPAEGTLSLAELVTRAGGFTDIAKGQDVLITHRGQSGGKKTITHVNVQAILHGDGELNADDPSLVLQPGDLIYVPEMRI